MAKNFLAALFVAVFSYSLWIYVNRDEKSLKENLQKKDKEDPKLLMENVLIQRYKQTKLDTRIQARKGKFVEPNLVAITGGIKVDRIGETRTESIESDNALATFKTDTVKGFITTGDLVNAKLNDNVKVDFGSYRLLTDFAEYFAQENAIVSDRPVTVQGEKKWFRGKSGFRADLSNETVDIFGKVNGEAVVK